MGFTEADRLSSIKPSPIRKVLDKAKKMQSEGRDIIHLEIGEPDFSTPTPIVAAAAKYMADGETHYTPNRGVRELLEAISADQLARNDLCYDPNEEIIVTVGVAEALFDAISAYIEPGDEVIGFTPAFMNYRADVAMAGGRFIAIPLDEKDGFEPDCAKLEAAVTAKTKMIILTNPCNPTGAVYSEEVLGRIARIADRRDLMVISDEIYDRLIFDGAKPRSIAAFPGMKNRTVLLNGFSKAYAMTGWRVGYLAADRSLISPILRIHQYLTTCLPAFVQKAIAKNMGGAETEAAISDMVDMFRERRDVLVSKLSEIPGVTFVVPRGAFYLLLNVSGTGMSGEEFATRLLEEKGVAVVPALAFGEAYGDYVRISYANSVENIAEGIDRMREFVDSASC